MDDERDPASTTTSTNAFLSTATSPPDPHGIITAGQHNKTGRQISIREGDMINETALLETFRAIVADNRAGIWRRIKAARGEMSDVLGAQ